MIQNSNTIICYKLAFIRSRFGINVGDTGYDGCLHNVIGTKLTLKQQTLANDIHTLILTRPKTTSFWMVLVMIILTIKLIISLLINIIISTII